ncbi:hypothetical protein FACS1894202_11170 [Clostridia bacterium]|nr:hypothetical protein FACS1894202_11170 [Clostridia bacterium]
MLTQEQIEALRVMAARLTEPITDFLIKDACRRIAKAGRITDTAEYQLERALLLGKDGGALQREVNKLLGDVYNGSSELITRLAAEISDYSGTVRQITRAISDQTLGTLRNVTRTLGMTDPTGHVLPLREAYISAMDWAHNNVAFGAMDYNTAIRRATQTLADAGISSIDYASGKSASLEAAVRRNVMGGLGQVVERVGQYNHDELGADGWEISAHAASAPDHEPYQGRQFSDTDYIRINGNLQRRISTLNCGHIAFPIILGVNAPQYTHADIERLRLENAEGVVVDGKRCTLYEATQRQRELERRVRGWKRRTLAAQATGDAEQQLITSTRLSLARQSYKAFSAKAGLRVQSERLSIANFGHSAASRASWTVRKNSPLQNPSKRDIISSIKSDGVDSVRSIGRIDPEKFKEISPKLLTDEVVLTDKQRAHIIESHAATFERYESKLKDIIENPDYVLADPKNPNTALVFKRVENIAEVVLRLSTENAKKKNSVITLWEIKEARLERYLKTHKIVYKRE